MDTTETYIKMCEKAEKTQTEAFRCLMPDDYVAYRHLIPEMNGKHMISTIWRVEREGLTTEAYSTIFIWLPRQDQLQEMVQGNETWWSLNNRFSLWVKEQFIKFLYLHNSGEQLWLAFVMKEKYNKVWDGKMWQLEST